MKVDLSKAHITRMPEPLPASVAPKKSRVDWRRVGLFVFALTVISVCATPGMGVLVAIATTFIPGSALRSK